MHLKYCNHQRYILSKLPFHKLLYYQFAFFNICGQTQIKNHQYKQTQSLSVKQEQRLRLFPFNSNKLRICCYNIVNQKFYTLCPEARVQNILKNYR